jgi:uncharacterized phage protein (TIGR01671 family)
MREIKFRAWYTTDKNMCEILRIDWKNRTCAGRGKWVNSDGKSGSFGFIDGPLVDFILMQCTDHHDRTGKDVYEGDICRFYAEPEEPNFFTGLAYMGNDEIGGNWKIAKCENEGGEAVLDSLSFWNDDFEVIGDIYSNPELQEVTK